MSDNHSRRNASKLRDTLLLVFILVALLGLIEYGSRHASGGTSLEAGSLFEKVAALAHEGRTIEYVKKSFGQLPRDIDPAQAGDAMQVGDVVFQFILQPNSNYYLPGLDSYYQNNEPVAWSGILAKNSAETEWRRYYEIKRSSPLGLPDARKLNPIGMFVRDGALFLDLADDRGPGSGEGAITRLRSANGGRSWQAEGCYSGPLIGYYVPTDYDRQKINPDRVEESDMCAMQSS